eukprot:8665608-Pyramimonas_sp.AAC.2
MGPRQVGSEDNAASLHRRCIADADAARRLDAVLRVKSTMYRRRMSLMHRCIADAADASPMRRRVADASATRRDPPTPSTPTPSRRPPQERLTWYALDDSEPAQRGLFREEC